MDLPAALCAVSHEAPAAAGTTPLRFAGPIYSIACHPSGQRFATCGSDNKIKIWSLKPLLSARESDLESAPRQLATLTDSISPVNVVRFSHCGRWLASGEAPWPPREWLQHGSIFTVQWADVRP